MALSKDKILRHAGSFTPREVHVPELVDESGDDVVLVRGMTAREWELNQATLAKDDEGTATAAVLVRCVLDPSGARVFADDDVRQIAELPWRAVQRLSRAIAEESGLNDTGEPDVEAAKGNSDAAPGGETVSD